MVFKIDSISVVLTNEVDRVLQSKISTTGFRFPVLPVKSSYSSFFWWGILLVPFLRCQSTLKWTRWPFWAAVVNSRPCLFEAHIIPLTFDHLHLDPTILLTSQIRLLKTQITLLKLQILPWALIYFMGIWDLRILRNLGSHHFEKFGISSLEL